MRQNSFNSPCKFGHFWRKLNFWGRKTSLLNDRSAQMRYEILRPSFFLAHCASFMSRWPLLRGGGGAGLHILSWKIDDFQIYISPILVLSNSKRSVGAEFVLTECTKKSFCMHIWGLINFEINSKKLQIILISYIFSYKNWFL